MAAPLADRIRPQSLDEMVGQQHLLGPNGLLRRIAQSGTLPNLIFYGPSGVGKTTAARIIAAGAGGFDAMGGVVLYLDEIQYLNKKQQQTLLEYIEDGSITLIASTTENPYFYVYNAILSRCTVFEFKPVDAAEVVPGAAGGGGGAGPYCRLLRRGCEKGRQCAGDLCPGRDGHYRPASHYAGGRETGRSAQCHAV